MVAMRMGRFRKTALAVLLCCAAAAVWAEESVEALLHEAHAVRTSDIRQLHRLLDRLDEQAGNATEEQRLRLQLLHAHHALMSGKSDDAIRTLEKVIEEAGENSVIRHRAGALLANTYAIIRRFEEGLRALDTVLSFSGEIEDAGARHQGFLAAGILYNQVGEYGLGRHYAEMVISEGSERRNLCIARNLILEARLGSGDKLEDPAIRAAISTCEEEGEPILVGFSYTYLARNLHAVGRTEEAIRVLERYLPKVEAAAYPMLKGEYHSMLAEYRMALGEIQAAERHARHTITHVASVANALPLVVAYRTLYEIAMHHGDPAASLEMYRLYAEADKAYLNEIKAREMAYQTVRHQSQRQLQEIELLNQKNTVLELQQRIAEQRAQNNGLIALLLTLLLASIGFWAYRTKRIQMRLRRMTEIDMLTGVCNRHHFTEKAQKALAQCAREGEPAALAMFDLDHFKQINDRFGHAAGDWALKQVAAACASLCRPIDCLGRLGGEEFAMLIPGCDARAAKRVAEDALARFAAIDSGANGYVLEITASFGVTDTSLSGHDFTRLLSHADKALYRAKREGRNRVRVYEFECVAQLPFGHRERDPARAEGDAQDEDGTRRSALMS